MAWRTLTLIKQEPADDDQALMEREQAENYKRFRPIQRQVYEELRRQNELRSAHRMKNDVTPGSTP